MGAFLPVSALTFVGFVMLVNIQAEARSLSDSFGISVAIAKELARNHEKQATQAPTTPMPTPKLNEWTSNIEKHLSSPPPPPSSSPRTKELTSYNLEKQTSSPPPPPSASPGKKQLTNNVEKHLPSPPPPPTSSPRTKELTSNYEKHPNLRPPPPSSSPGKKELTGNVEKHWSSPPPPPSSSPGKRGINKGGTSKPVTLEGSRPPPPILSPIPASPESQLAVVSNQQVYTRDSACSGYKSVITQYGRPPRPKPPSPKPATPTEPILTLDKQIIVRERLPWIHYFFASS
ncbi:hypothetical protein Tsubulata_029298 [Turnera subulata]|uniref:Uncharacterized protein n=1 Tax=Turnera subulata TaxID=218843 RepID=A0A9Q0G1J3_9ROSI|nr:hypothetical protein Tsubulata_029298 [Turnera subulata]